VWLALALVVAVARRRSSIVLYTAAAVLAADLAAAALKAAVDRARPLPPGPDDRPLVHVPGSGSFPSGHAATSFAAAAILTWIVPRLAPAWYVLAAAIAFSRIYVGVHYPADVVGGAILGTVIALLLLAAGRWRSWPVPRGG
jgi:undecaprenyl-diphosphatase